MSSPTTVVLGWDGLDYDLCESFGVSEEFGPRYRRIDTVENDVFGKPHTYEVWPSIITGVEPDVHGVQIINDGEGARMSNPVMRAMSGAAHHILSKRARIRLGLALRNRGLSLRQRTPDWYSERGLDTVFDGRRSRPIGIPNYRVDEDDELDVVSGWGRTMSRYIDIEVWEEKRTVVYHPAVELERIEEWLIGEARKKLGVLRVAAGRDYDLVFVWLSFLDTVGHMVPVVDDGWQRCAYGHAVEMTNEVRSWLGEDDRLVVVSDHGHRGAEHTKSAFLGSTDARVLEGVESVTDVRDGIERVTPSNESDVSEVEAAEADYAVSTD